MGLRKQASKQAITIEGLTLFPSDYFEPLDGFTMALNLTENTRCIHHFGGSWQTESQHYRKKITAAYYEKTGKQPGFLRTLYFVLLSRLKYEGVFATVKWAVEKVFSDMPKY
jgi:hypothetical protein